MSNPFYEPGEKRAARVNDLFGAIARRYDLINDLQSFGLHRRWKRQVADLAAVQPGGRALDLCCGTGDIAFALAAKGAEVTGLDFSEAMLEVAEKRRTEGGGPKAESEVQHRTSNIEHRTSNGRKGEMGNRGEKREAESGTGLRSEATARQEADDNLEPRTLNLEPRTSKDRKGETGNPTFVQGDAMATAFPDGTFDAVTMGYGLRNLSNWEAGLREMLRVTKPGGRVVVLEFGKPDNALWRAVYLGYLRFAVPVMGLLFCGNAAAYAYILESLKHYPGQRGVAAKMSELGLVNVKIINLLGGAMSINYGEKAGSTRVSRVVSGVPPETIV